MPDPRGPAAIPRLSLLLGFGPMLLFPALALVAWGWPEWRWLALAAGQVWASALLVFIAGVRRGLSFFTEGGPRPAQIAATLWLFAAGLTTLLAPLPWSHLVPLAGFASLAASDPPAARRGEVPAFFARLRPAQSAIACAGLAGLLAVALAG